MFGDIINFGVMPYPQHFYNKSYAKSCYQWVKINISIWPKLESITAYHIRFVVKLL